MWAWVKKVLGSATGICTPDQTPATLTPLSEVSGSAQSLSTPLPLGYSSGQAGSISSSATAQDVPDKTPEDAGGPSGAGRFIVSAEGMPVGIANTVSRYRESQPVRTHMTPFEQRIAAKLTEEQQVAAAAAAAAGSIDDNSSDVSSVHPHQLHFPVSANVNSQE